MADYNIVLLLLRYDALQPESQREARRDVQKEMQKEVQRDMVEGRVSACAEERNRGGIDRMDVDVDVL